MRTFLIIITTVMVLACAKTKIPKGILTEKEITPVLVELHLAESIFAQRYALESTRDNYQEDLYLSILKKYNLDQKVFETSVLYYGKHPEVYKPIYDEVLDRLNEMNAKVRAKDSIQTLVRDSIEIHVKDSIQTRIKDSIQSGTKDSIQIRTIDSIQSKVKDSIRAMH